MSVSILIIQILNSLFYASVLFLIAAGLSLIFGVMRIVNMAHGTFYAVGAFVTAWLVGRAIALGVPAGWTFLLIPVGAGVVALLRIVIEPLLRPFYRRAEEYQLLVTFGLLLILEDVIRLLWGGLPLSADPVMDVLPSIRIGGLIYPGYNLVVIAVGAAAAVGLWAVIYRTKFGVMLRATSQDRRMASALGLNVALIYVSAFAIGCFMAGLGGAIIVPSQAAVLGMGIDALVLAFVVVVIGGLGSLQGALIGALIVSFVRTAGIQFFPEIELAVLYLIAAVVVVLALLALLPPYIGLYQTQLLTYGLIAAIAALGFNLLLGYTGLLSFGHSAFFGIGAYSVALLLRDAGIHSMELYVLIGLPIAAVTSALFGYICVRHTRIFFGILTLALSQVLWTLAYKFFWVTGGSDGLRVARPTLLAGMLTFTGGGSFQRFINAYYYYVLGVFAICVVIMWVIVHSPFGKALQAIRDNETRAAFLGLRIRRFRWVSFLISGTFTGLAGILWVPLNGLTTPEVMYWPFSGEIVFMTLLGGFRNFTGPVVGGLLFTYLKTYAVATTEYWQLLLGVVLVLLVMLLPTGIVGAISAVADKLRPQEKSS